MPRNGKRQRTPEVAYSRNKVAVSGVKRMDRERGEEREREREIHPSDTLQSLLRFRLFPSLSSSHSLSLSLPLSFSLSISLARYIV